MYYVSRRYGTNKFGVTDTEDGVEEMFTYQELKEAVVDLGIDIKGVEVFTRCTRQGQRRSISGISVYQLEDTVQTKQIKLHVLTGVDVKTAGDEIVGISWSNPDERKPYSLRLSNYGKSCANYIFSDIKEYRWGLASFLTIILDDKIEVTSKTFKRCAGFGVIVDLREVTNEKTVKAVYSEMISERYMSSTRLPNHVIDNEERLNYWRAVCILNGGFKSGEFEKPIRHLFPNPNNILTQIDKKYSSEFLSISNCSFAVSQRGRVASLFKQYVIWVTEPKMQYVLDCADVDTLRETILDSLFRMLAWCTTCNKSVLERFKNYIKYFEPTADTRDAFLIFCRRANNFALKYGINAGWIYGPERGYAVRK